MDGGFVHAKDQKSRGEGWFEVIAGKSMPEEGAAKCFAYVQTYDTKPKRRLFERKRMVKKQQVQWSEAGAHHLLQVRTKALNDELRQTFVRWYPGMQTNQEANMAKNAA